MRSTGLFAFFVIAACSGKPSGSDSSSPSFASTGGASGAVASGGASGSIAGSGTGQAGSQGSIPGGVAGGGGGSTTAAPMSKTEACLIYARAVSARTAECRGGSLSASYRPPPNCPDVLFSDGSTRTVAGLLACIDDWRAFPCDQLQRGFNPDCVTPGTRAPGASCIYPSQCSSLQCLRGAACGTCAQSLGEGAACPATGAACDFGLTCSSGKCVKLDPAAPQPQLMPLPTGASCTNAGPCKDTDYCDDSAMQGNFVCTPLPALGQMCTHAGSYCAMDGYCDPDHNVCIALPAAGQPCGLLRGDPYYCAQGLYCDTATGSAPVCRAAPKLGEACSTSGPPCVDTSATCACDAPGCAVPHCAVVLEVGAACGAPAMTCYPGSACSGGVCTPIDSQGLFAAACKP